MDDGLRGARAQSAEFFQLRGEGGVDRGEVADLLLLLRHTCIEGDHARAEVHILFPRIPQAAGLGLSLCHGFLHALLHGRLNCCNLSLRAQMTLLLHTSAFPHPPMSCMITDRCTFAQPVQLCNPHKDRTSMSERSFSISACMWERALSASAVRDAMVASLAANSA
jgi:hypothetical protein